MHVDVLRGKRTEIHRTGNYASDQIIWIEGEKIKAIGKATEIQKQYPPAQREKSSEKVWRSGRWRSRTVARLLWAAR
jgi:hypothetical protein